MSREPAFLPLRRAADRIVQAWRRIGSATGGVSAVEFALVMPVLILLMMGVVEINRLTWANKKTQIAANAVGEMLSSAQTPPTAGDLQFISDAGMIIDPQVLLDAQAQGTSWSSILQITYTNIVFTPTLPGCLVSCTYTANVAWSAGAHRRACGTLNPAPDGSGYGVSTLPKSLFGPSSTIAVDVQYLYTPIFGSRIAGSRTLSRTAYFVPRYFDPLTLGDLSANPSIATRCPGYS